MRRHELGVRAALGARSAALARLVMWEGMRHVALGVTAGIAIVVVGANVLSGQLYEVSPRDPAVISLAVLMLLISAALATLIPARRALRADPMVALRSE
jgi:ABC-type antimicrobial peptide transport system permease subunit